MPLTIEHHAVMFALLAKHAIEISGEKGKEAILSGMTRYGNERGRRMALNALERGDKLTVLNSQAYGEWKPDFPGQMEFGVTCGMPVLHTYIAKCAWCDAWAKHGLTEYGKYYCCNIDNAWFQGFNPEFTCTQLNPPMSWGGDCCRFSWGEGLTHKQIKALNKKKKSLGNACIKDFTFHTAHILHTVGDVLMEELGNDGAMAVSSCRFRSHPPRQSR